MSRSKQKAVKKKSPLMEAFSWCFDIALVCLLIWFFSSTQNQALFWSSIPTFIEKTFNFALEAASKKLPQSNKESQATVTKTAEVNKLSTPDQSTVLPPSFVPPPLPSKEQLAAEIEGDCCPPEPRSQEDANAVAGLFYQPPPLLRSQKERKGNAKPLKFEKRTINKVPFYQLTIDLNDPESYIVIRLPKKAEQANSSTYSVGHETFDKFVKEYPAAAMVNGTFFSKDEQERVMGNMVSEGKMLKYSPWENYGTTLYLLEGDYPEMVTARAEGKPDWFQHWFSLTCGPRLLKAGEVWINPELEGFTDPHVLGCGARSAIGFPKSRDKLYLITFLRGLSLKDEAKMMKAIGCYEAMNLDGGASKALYSDKSILMKPGRGLTNVLVLYDSKHQAPKEVKTAWQDFQNGRRPQIGGQ